MKLKGKPDGSFLVRDSSDPRYILSLSFRSQGVTHHTRMEHYRGKTHSGWGAVELLLLVVVVVGGGGGLMTTWAFVGRLFENHQKKCCYKTALKFLNNSKF